MGFRTLGHVQLFMRLDGDNQWRAGIELHEREFDY
jgi:hypothetical protein